MGRHRYSGMPGRYRLRIPKEMLNLGQGKGEIHELRELTRTYQVRSAEFGLRNQEVMRIADCGMRATSSGGKPQRKTQNHAKDRIISSSFCPAMILSALCFDKAVPALKAGLTRAHPPSAPKPTALTP